MVGPPPPPALLQFIDDELLRAPLLFDQVVEGALDGAHKAIPTLNLAERSAAGDLMTTLKSQRARLLDRFLRSLREQVDAELAQRQQAPAPAHAPKPSSGFSLALVDEDEVAADVELARTIENIKSVAEFEMRELATFTAALVGDMDLARDHNPFRAETYARALWAAAQGLRLSRGHQVMFMRTAGPPLAQLLRKTYSASCSRLESLGVEPAAYRTLILPAGSRRGRRFDSTYSPDLAQIRETMPAELYESHHPPLAPVGHESQPQDQQRRAQRREIARATTNPVDRQAIELVSRLFDAILADPRVPADVQMLISRLHGPALRLTLADPSMLDKETHPLWRFVNRLAYEAEMAPDVADPERMGLLKLAHATVNQLTSEPEQTAPLYRWALERLDIFLKQRLTRRLAALASQIGALQKLEDKLAAGHSQPTTLHGTLDSYQLDTVPAELMVGMLPEPTGTLAEDWLEDLRAGDWVRMFLQGHWIQAQLLWPGERQQIWLFGDGASDATWGVRRGALLVMYSERLLKTLKQRSVLRAAAEKVQLQVAGSVAE
jgi:hypothetical protein